MCALREPRAAGESTGREKEEVGHKGELEYGSERNPQWIFLWLKGNGGGGGGWQHARERGT